MGFSSAKSALVTVILAYCFVTVILAIATGLMDYTSLSVAFGIMACVAAIGGILVIRFFKDDCFKNKKDSDEINSVETRKFLDEDKK